MSEPKMYEVPAAVLHELRALRQIGDTLQSEASRLAEYVERGDGKPFDAPYEVAMACHEIRDSVIEWTHARSLSGSIADGKDLTDGR